jgi:hypothetical protein
MRMQVLLMSLVWAAWAGAQALWPIECDSVEGWTRQPGWVGDPTEKAEATAEAGVLTFSVSEPGRGMKWTLPVERLDTTYPGYLLVRCRAENIRTGSPYVLWGVSSSGDGTIIKAGDFPVDGQWHDIAVDLFAQGFRGRLYALAVEVQAGEQVPARLSFDYLRIVTEAPEGAIALPANAPAPFEWREEFDGGLHFEAHESWLANPAPKGQYDLRQADGLLTMTVNQPNRGMKWSAQLDQPIDASNAAYLTIRYRAEGATQWGDYFVWAGSETGGQPQEAATLIGGTQVRSDGRWHTEVLTVEKLFPIKEIAVQLQAGDGLRVTGDGNGTATAARAEIDYIALSTRLPRLPIGEMVAFAAGRQDLRAPEARFACVPLTGCNASGKEVAHTLGAADWFTDRQITVCGIPFELATGEQTLAATPRNSTEPYPIPVGRRADDLCLFIAARLPSEDWSGGLGSRALKSFRQPERFRIAVDYEDGATDWHFPARASDGVYEVSAGVDAYVLPGLREVPIRQIRLRSAMTDSTIAVAAVTAYRGEPLVQPEAVSVLPPAAPRRAVRETAAELAVEQGRGDGSPPATTAGGTPALPGDVNTTARRVVLSNAYLRAEFSVGKGVRLESIQNRCLRAGKMTLAPGPIFLLTVGETEVDSTQVAVGEVREERGERGVAVTVPVDAREKGIPLAGELTLRLGTGPELEMRLDLKHVGDEVIRPGVIFPQLSDLVLGSAEDTWYLYCGRGGIISNRPIWAAEAYSGRHPLQITDAFNPKLGGGLYMMVHDLDDIYKYHALRKDDKGVMMRADYFRRDYQPGERIEIAPTVIGAHTGDWRVALDAYRQWTRTWYRPAAPRKQWFKECFNYRQHLVRGGLYDFATQTYHMKEALEKDIEFFGRVDYFHLFDFGQSSKYGRVGDYSHYDEIGGREKLAEAIRGVEQTGTRVGLYIEGYLVDERGEFGRDHVGQWHIIKADGEPLLWPGAPSEHMMCPACEGWQDYLAGTYKRVAGELHPNGMYIDQHGFADAGKICYSPDHGHPVPQPPLRGEREMGRKIRAAVPPEIATLTEETPVDVNSQYQDGALGYSVWQADAGLAPHRIQLFRFCFPDFKVFQLVSYNPFIEGGWELLKYPFFNGEGTWLGNDIPSGFDADAQAFLRKSFALLHDHRAAFTSDDVEALVPTESALICANRFSTEDETVWTLLNVGFSTYRGPVLSLEHKPGAKYLDLWNGKELRPKVNGGRAILELEIGPREVGCVGRQ